MPESIKTMSLQTLGDEIVRGGKLVTFPYCISIIVMTFRRSSEVYLVRPGEVAFSKGWPFLLLSLFLGWWGFPWGLIYTPVCLFQILAGGKDVTKEILDSIQVEANRAAAFAPPAAAVIDPEAVQPGAVEPSTEQPAPAKNPWAM